MHRFRLNDRQPVGGGASLRLVLKNLVDMTTRKVNQVSVDFVVIVD